MDVNIYVATVILLKLQNNNDELGPLLPFQLGLPFRPVRDRFSFGLISPKF